MTFVIHGPIQIAAMTFLLGLAFVPIAYAGSGDPMSRDVEFRESLTRHDEPRELVAPRPVLKAFGGRADTSKKDRIPK